MAAATGEAGSEGAASAAPAPVVAAAAAPAAAVASSSQGDSAPSTTTTTTTTTTASTGASGNNTDGGGAEHGGGATGAVASSKDGSGKAPKKLQLNPEVPEFQPSASPSASGGAWAPAVARNMGLRPPPGVMPSPSPTSGSNGAAAGAGGSAGAGGGVDGDSDDGSSPAGKKSRRRKRRGRKRGTAGGEDTSRIVKIVGMTNAEEATLLKALLTQLFGPVAAFSCGAAKGQQVVGLVTFSTAESAQRAIRSASVNHNGTTLKLMRHQTASGSGSAPSNIVRLSGLPLTTTAESLAKILAKHGARASVADMQMSPSGDFTGVVLCRYCSTDAAARAVNQLGDSVVEGHTLKATYNVATAGGASGTTGGNGSNGSGSNTAGAGRKANNNGGNSSGSGSGSGGNNNHGHRGSPIASRLVMVPAVPHSGGSASAAQQMRQRRRSRGYSEDWTSSRRTPETHRYRAGSFARSSALPEGQAALSPSDSTWLKRRARSLSGCGSAPPIPVRYAAGPDGSVGFERIRRGRSRSLSIAGPPPEAAPAQP